ncbi:MAG: hypothetical protein ABEH43_02370, partial [Flavobacteriales bacterium]
MKISLLSTITLSLMITLLISSCGYETKEMEKESKKATVKPENRKNSKIEKLHKEVMKVHDEAMEEMSTIQKLKKKLDEKEVNKKEKDFVKEHKKSLNEAHEAMMKWMREFDMPRDSANITKYLKKEKKRVKDMRDKVEESISEA